MGQKFEPLRKFDKDYRASEKSFRIMNLKKFLEKIKNLENFESIIFDFQLINLFSGETCTKKLRVLKFNNSYHGNFDKKQRFKILIKDKDHEFSLL